MLISCTSREDSTDVEGIWIRSGFTKDLGYYLPPYPSLFKFNEDSLLIKDAIGVRKTEMEYAFLDSLIIINGDTSSVTVKEDIMTLNGYTFVRLPDNTLVKELDCIQSILSDTDWQVQNDVFRFDFEKNRFSKIDLKTNIQTHYCIKIKKIFDYYFIVKYGNHLECEGHYQILEQILSISKDKMLVQRWIGNKYEQIAYQPKEKSEFIGNDSFQVCNTHLLKRHLGHLYSVTGARFNGGLYSINKRLANFYKKPTLLEEGLIRIRFVVNCEGETGNFEVLELDANYQKKKFKSNIPQQLLTFCRGLQGWIPGKREEYVVDSYKFLTFKIKDSEIVEIFP
jgi:hypothetical protein